MKLSEISDERLDEISQEILGQCLTAKDIFEVYGIETENLEQDFVLFRSKMIEEGVDFCDHCNEWVWTTELEKTLMGMLCSECQVTDIGYDEG